MNSVDIYVNGLRLDLFDDEQISINLSVQNVQDISKVFTDFTQGFTVPATARNNAILQHYYRTDVDSSTITTKTLLNAESLFLDYRFRVLKDGGRIEGADCCIDKLDALGGSLVQTTQAVSFDGRFRQQARIEINSLPFRTGVIELENTQLKGTEPYAYTLTFYGDLVSLTDLFGEDYLYDLDFSAFDHAYTDNAIYERFTTDNHPVFYPLMSPVKNWYYDSDSANDDPNNIADNGSANPHGINYYELKPAVKVTSVISAMEAKYGITFTGSFLASAPFTDLSLWLHRTEGYLFDANATIDWQLINFNRGFGSGAEFNLSTETWTVGSDGIFDITIQMKDVDEDYQVGLFQNGQLVASFVRTAHPTSVILETFVGLGGQAGDEFQLFIRPIQPLSFNYQCIFYNALDQSNIERFQVDQSLAASYPFKVIISSIMPEIKVKDFLAGILKMYNLALVPNSSTSFLVQPLSDWYAAGSDQNYQTYFDITEYVVNRPPLYRQIEFKYQETDQILGFQYRNTNGIGFGDLRSNFPFDGDEFTVEVPFECPLFERLTNQQTQTLTNVLVYKSITDAANEDGTFNPYLGAPILFYAYYDHDIDANAISFVDSDGTTLRPTSTVWYANTSNTPVSAAASRSICFGADIDPYHFQSVTRSLYSDYWNNYITDLYDKQRRLVQVEAVLPLGKILTLNLQNAVIWNGTRYLVNNVSINMTTGRATFELLNVV